MAVYGGTSDFQLVDTDAQSALVADKRDLSHSAFENPHFDEDSKRIVYLHPSNLDGNSTQPALAMGSDKALHVVWREAKEKGGSQIVHSISTDAGKTWREPDTVSTFSYVASEPTIAVDTRGDLHVAWLDRHEGEAIPDIFYARGSKGTWTAPARRNNSSKNCTSLQIACGNKVSTYIAWCENDGQSKNVWCIATDRRGKSWKINIAEGAGKATDVRVVASGSDDRVAVVWAQSNGAGESKLCARLSRDGFDEISDEIVLANSNEADRHYAVTILGGKLFALWKESDSIKSATLGFNGIATGPSTVGEMVSHPHHGY